MQKEGRNPEKEGIEYLSQLIKSLDESTLKLEEYYESRDNENFDKIKKFIFNIIAKISEVAQ